MFNCCNAFIVTCCFVSFATLIKLGGDVPEASTLGRFRNQLVEHDLWERLLGEINRQLEVKNIIMT